MENSKRMNEVDSLFEHYDSNQAHIEKGIVAIVQKIAATLNSLPPMFSRKKIKYDFDGILYLTSEEIEEATKELE